MPNSHTDVLIHTPMPLNKNEFSEIQERLIAIDGVVRFDQHERHPSMIMVTYISQKIRALTILNKLTRLGFNASLVGM